MIDFAKYPNLASVDEHPPTCADCGEQLFRFANPFRAIWSCVTPGCDGDFFTDEELDDRIGDGAASAYERARVV